ncbi:hypothetical protein [Umezawaea beigongshangensis]|uniref:hypothetical protein n=1 Tax=Umezawaea beigongshangensis TaxID=2780383 RepID=UPI0018F1C673|nr:hypothetical protein [Umezawaea beigongshangensis]
MTTTIQPEDSPWFRATTPAAPPAERAGRHRLAEPAEAVPVTPTRWTAADRLRHGYLSAEIREAIAAVHTVYRALPERTSLPTALLATLEQLDDQLRAAELAAVEDSEHASISGRLA